MSEELEQIPPLDIIYELEYQVIKADVVKTALELDIFTTINQGHHTLDDIVQTTGYDRCGLRILMDALCPLGLLTKSKNGYNLTATTETYLVRGKSTFYGDWTLRTQIAWQVRNQSAEAVRTGRAVGGDYSLSDKNDEWVMDYSPALLNWPERAEMAREMWDKLDVGKEMYPALRILDAACGHGIKNFVLAQADDGVRVTAVDFPKMLELTAEIADQMGVRHQVEFISGDVSVMEFGVDEYDVIQFGLILYYFKGKRLESILRSARKALKPGGMLVINEPIADEEHCESEAALLAAYQLLLFAPDSQVRTFLEYKQILENVGFVGVFSRDETLVTAMKNVAA